MCVNGVKKPTFQIGVGYNMTKMADRELLLQALDALEMCTNDRMSPSYLIKNTEAIEALRTRLAQPEKEWVGLTDEDRWELVQKTPSFDEVVAAVEAKLKEKNHG